MSTGPARAGPHGAPPEGSCARVTGFAHVGLVVEDLGAVCQALERLLGLAGESLALPGVGLEARVFGVGGAAVEVLRFRGDVPGIDPRVTRPVPGVHHLAFWVGDLQGCLEQLERRGIRPLEGFPRPGLHGPIAFVSDPASGVLVELAQREDVRDG